MHFNYWIPNMMEISPYIFTYNLKRVALLLRTLRHFHYGLLQCDFGFALGEFMARCCSAWTILVFGCFLC